MAGKYSEELIDEIRRQTDIVAVISEYVALKRTGQNFTGLCPFHHEKTPSFVVNPVKQIFHCYGCSAGGNVITFLMQQEKYTFPETVQLLARKLGLSLAESTSPAASQQATRTDALYRLHRDAAAFFSAQLLNSQEGQRARDYLQQRGISADMITAFGLGFALPEWDRLRNELSRKYSEDVLFESGLLSKNEEKGRKYDRFRNRLMIPIHDERGRMIAFGGRILGDGQPKYLNSPESPIFHKSKTLFGLHHAKDAIRQEGAILIVEGYFDMMTPYSYGVRNIAATMGTALTEQHLNSLRRYTNTVILLFDPDPAGIKAVLRTLDLFLASGMEAKAVILPRGEDPDTAIQKLGVEQFRAYIRDAPLLLDFMRERIVEQYDLNRLAHQIACANQILPTLAKIQNIIERNAQIAKTADVLRITDQALLQQFTKLAQTGKIQPLEVPSPPSATIPLPVVERCLVKALIKDKSLIATVQRELDVTAFTHPVTRAILQELFVYNDKTDFEARLFDRFRGHDGFASLSELLVKTDEIIEPAQTVQDCLKQLRQKRFEHATREVSRKLRDAQEGGRQANLDAFLERKNRDLWQKKQQGEK